MPMFFLPLGNPPPTIEFFFFFNFPLVKLFFFFASFTLILISYYYLNLRATISSLKLTFCWPWSVWYRVLGHTHLDRKWSHQSQSTASLWVCPPWKPTHRFLCKQILLSRTERQRKRKCQEKTEKLSSWYLVCLSHWLWDNVFFPKGITNKGVKK